MNQPGSMVVSLSSDTFEKMPGAGQPLVSNEAKEAASQDSAMPAEEEIAENVEKPEIAGTTSEEKPAAVPEEQKAAEIPGMVGEVPPGAGQDMVELARMHHIIAVHKRAFVETATQSIQRALHKEIADDPSGGLKEGTAEITFYFNEGGDIGQVWGSSGSEELQAALERLDWRTVPSPADFRFRMNGLRISIKIEKGEPALSFYAL